MQVRQLQPPSDLPVTLDELKLHCRVDFEDDDTSLQMMLEAAVSQLDGFAGSLGRSIMSQRWALDLPSFPRCGYVDLPLGPVASVEEVSYADTSGDDQVLDAEAYAFHGTSGRLTFLSPPSTAPGHDAVRIEYTAGWADASAVPANIRAAILLIAADLYEHREAGSQQPINLNPALGRLLRPVARVRV